MSEEEEEEIVFRKPGADSESETVVPTKEQIGAMVEDNLSMPGCWLDPADW